MRSEIDRAVFFLVLMSGAVGALPAEESEVLVTREFRRHTYELRSQPDGIDGTAAHSEATALGGHLATIADREENDFVFRLAQDPAVDRACDERLFLGGSDAASEGDWAWVDRSRWHFENWEPEAPDGALSENYLTMCIGPAGDGCCRADGWNDVSATTNLRYFVVEYPSAQGEYPSAQGATGEPPSCGELRLEGEWSATQTVATRDFHDNKEVAAEVRGLAEIEIYSGLVAGAGGEVVPGTGEVLDATWELSTGMPGFNLSCDYGHTLTETFQFDGFLKNLEPDGVDLRLSCCYDNDSKLWFNPHPNDDCAPGTISGTELIQPVEDDPLYGLDVFQLPIPTGTIHVPLDEQGNGQVALHYDAPAPAQLCAGELAELLEMAAPSCHITSDFTIQLRGVDPTTPCKPRSLFEN